MTTGKIYAGKIILENWRAYKECMIRGESGPKAVSYRNSLKPAVRTGVNDLR